MHFPPPDRELASRRKRPPLKSSLASHAALSRVQLDRSQFTTFFHNHTIDNPQTSTSISAQLDRPQFATFFHDHTIDNLQPSPSISASKRCATTVATGICCAAHTKAGLNASNTAESAVTLTATGHVRHYHSFQDRAASGLHKILAVQKRSTTAECSQLTTSLPKSTLILLYPPLDSLNRMPPSTSSQDPRSSLPELVSDDIDMLDRDRGFRFSLSFLFCLRLRLGLCLALSFGLP